MKFIEVFLFISMIISPDLFFPGSAEADIGWGVKLTRYSMASCTGNIHTKNF